MNRLFIIILTLSFSFTETVTLSPTQSWKLTHNSLCCGFNTYLNSSSSPLWIGECNSNVFGCVSSSLAGVWRWDLSEFQGATFHSAVVDFSPQSGNCSNGGEYAFNPITGTMNSSQAMDLHNNPMQSGSSSLFGNVNVNINVMDLALQEGSLGAYVYSNSSCAMNNSGNSAPMLIINYTPGVSATGDYNNDGLINVTDIVSTVNIVLGINEFSAAVDLNSDGMINVLDIVSIVNIVLGN